MLLPVHRSTAVAGLVGLVLIVACILGRGGARATAARPEKAATRARRQAKATAAPSPAGRKAQAKARSAPAARPAVSRAQRALTAAIGPIARGDEGQVAVAVDDLTTG